MMITEKWFQVSLVAMMFFAIGPVCMKTGMSELSWNTTNVIRLVADGTIALLVLMYLGSSSFEPPTIDYVWPFIAGATGGAATLMFLFSINYGQTSVVAAVVHSFPLLVALTSWFFLGEEMTAVKVTGLLFTVAGLVILSVEQV